MTKKITSPLKAAPLIFRFQVDSFELLETPQELAEWERLMKEAVRLEGFDVNKVAGGGSLSGCGAGNRPDDCDIVQV